MSSALLFSQMSPPPDEEEEFHDWYEHEHIPARMAVEGFRRATRWKAVDGSPAFLAVYELEDLTVLEQPAYRALKEAPSARTARMLATVTAFSRYLLVRRSAVGVDDGTVLQAVAFPVPDRDQGDFDDWYEKEHVPLLMKEPKWRGVSRWVLAGPHDGPWYSHFALHALEDPTALASPFREAARTTEWRDRLAEREWFDRAGRWLYQLVSTATPTDHGGFRR